MDPFLLTGSSSCTWPQSGKVPRGYSCQSPKSILISSHTISLDNSYTNSKIYIYSYPWPFNFLRTSGILGVSFKNSFAKLQPWTLTSTLHPKVPKHELSMLISYPTLKARSTWPFPSLKTTQLFSFLFHFHQNYVYHFFLRSHRNTTRIINCNLNGIIIWECELQHIWKKI